MVDDGLVDEVASLVRFENQDVFNHQENVLNFIRETVEERKKNIN